MILNIINKLKLINIMKKVNMLIFLFVPENERKIYKNQLIKRIKLLKQKSFFFTF